MAHPIATQCQPGFSPRPPISEDELSAEIDEPPDESLQSTRATPLKTPATPVGPCTVSSLAQNNKKASLLTQALLTSDDSTTNSDTEAPLLTSDVDLTSPTGTNSPSPPLLTSSSRGLATLFSQERQALGAQNLPEHDKLHRATEKTDSAAMTDLEAGLGRKRCIKFACGRQDTARPEGLQAAKPPITSGSDTKATASTKRPCMLRFVCPIRASARSTTDRHSSANLSNNDSIERFSSATQNPVFDFATRQHRDSVSTIKAVPTATQGTAKILNSTSKSPASRNSNTENSEATRFHEFAGPYSTEDKWIHEQPISCKKITVNDTLRKENAIRQLGEEVEEEALEEQDAEEQDEELYAELEELDDDLSSDYSVSDDGNETDDEEGFAESDNESEVGSDYQFWTPGLTTAATSADHLEHIRPNAPRTASDSSIESMIRVKDTSDLTEAAGRRVRKKQATQPVRMRPGTPDLPDSTDFVCGTLDEDRPLEAAYMSCLEERRRSKRCVIPQDIDPSFPTSEPEDDKHGDTSSESKATSDEPLWVIGQPDHSDEERTNTRRRPLTRRKPKSPMPSPKRLRSPPPPQKRSMVRRSPPPVAHHAAASDFNASMPRSPTDDKHWPPSQTITPNLHERTKLAELTTGDLPRRPQLTHTASLPRTPNPFWAPHRVGYTWSSTTASPKGRQADVCSRGPIDIVTGLEKKRQRRKEKYWRQHCRNGVKEKERRCQPGKGALRMRELGLEMAGKSKGYLPHAQLMLSV
ncbi:MAG: hypothetical protein Q9215_006189 [Flavoplaca cf. flavocitrina]